MKQKPKGCTKNKCVTMIGGSPAGVEFVLQNHWFKNGECEKCGLICSSAMVEWIVSYDKVIKK